jgi:ATP-dependent protease ClpP protease subunit
MMTRIEIRGFIAGPEWDLMSDQPYIERGLWTPESRVRRQLADSTGPIDLYINSPGGSVFDAYEIINGLEAARAAGRKIDVTVGGMAASAASMIAVMFGRTFKAHRNTKIMFHGATAVTWAGSEAHRDSADLLDKINADMKAVLVSRYNLDAATVAEWFAEGREGWLTADEARAAGMVSEIVDGDAEMSAPSADELAGLADRGGRLAAYWTPRMEMIMESENKTVEERANEAYDEGHAAGMSEGIASARQELDEQMQEATAKAEALETEVAEIRSALAARESDVATVRAELEAARAELEEVTARSASLEDDNAALAKDAAASQTALTDANARLAQLLSGAAAPPVDDTNASGSAYWNLVAKIEGEGVPRFDAILQARRQAPELHRAMLAEANNRK